MTEQNITKGYEPKLPLSFFEEICKIPHPSFHEEKIADYLEEFANKRGLYCYRDSKNNVLIKKEAAEKYKNSPAILLQGHTDMVGAKDADCQKDLEKEGLDLYIEDGLLKAKGTTLGGDDGIAVAIMLALLDGELNEHPALECLFTVEEEVGLNGAREFDCSKISAKRMINLDSESEGEICAGCSGGVRNEIKAKCEKEKPFGKFLEVAVGGLFGGHSGVEINCGRKSAIIACFELLDAVCTSQKVGIHSLFGGDKDNAIPRDCKMKICVENDIDALAAIKEAALKIRNTLIDEDVNFFVKVEEASEENEIISAEFTEKIKNTVLKLGSGVISMCEEPKGLVEFSKNLGIAKVDTDALSLTYSCRSAKESQLDLACEAIEASANALGGNSAVGERYPGWDYAIKSELRVAYANAYKRLTGKDINVVVIHAGLECGLIKASIPDIDIISVGPNIFNIHTPKEALDLASFARVYETVKETILSL